VRVDGVVESRRSRKVRAGQVVVAGDARITVVAPPPAP
jgi:ribosome-associated protein YbcJ (S4-like RNA binding protein)